MSPPELAELLEINIGKILCFENGTIPIPKVFELALETLEKRLNKAFPKTENLPMVEVLQIVNTARNAELRRDFQALQKIFGTLHQETETVRNFDGYDPKIRAELLRLYGFYLSLYGQAKNLKDYHRRAIDILTVANMIFTEIKDDAKAAECNIQIAFCYWNTGEVENCEAFLKLSEYDFSRDFQHQVYLRIKINQIMLFCYLGRIAESFEIYEQISPLVELCSDIRMRVLFHFESGILLHRKKKYHVAVFHFNESIRLTKENGNFQLLGLTYNNLSLLYLELEAFGDAHLFNEKSLKVLKETNQTGWIPHILDSKALILIEEGNYQTAFEKVEEALNYFYQGEDYKGLIASLWTRVVCLLRLGRGSEAVYAYGELQKMATELLSEAAGKRYADDFEKEIYLLRGLPMDEELLNLEKTLITRSLVKTGGAKVKAAKILKLKTHQALSYALKERHPELYSELGFRTRAPRGSTIKKKRSFHTVSFVLETPDDFPHLNVQGKKVWFDFKGYALIKEYKAFYFNEDLMNGFEIFRPAIVAVRPVKEFKPDMLLVVLDDNQITLSRTVHDEEFDLYLIYNEKGEPIFLEEHNVLGEPVGFCLLEDMKDDEIRFSKLL